MRITDCVSYGCMLCSASDNFPSTPVRGVTADSRLVEDGFLFVAVRGTKISGINFIKEAINNGAIACIGDSVSFVHISSLYNASLPIPYLLCDNPREMLGRIGIELRKGNFPKNLVAVTGTNGKTSVSHFVRQIWEHNGISAASIGTNGIHSNDRIIPLQNTTPDPCVLHEHLERLYIEGVTHVALEASSHGLEQRRMDGLQLKAGALTNITREHMDYHGTFTNYVSSKLRLFTHVLQQDSNVVLAPGHDVYSCFSQIANARGLRMWRYGKNIGHNKGDNMDRALVLVSSAPDGDGTVFTIEWHGYEYNFRISLAGYFQIENILCAMSLCMACGMDFISVCDAIPFLKCVHGRMEKVASGYKGGTIYVDYAHTPDGMEKALRVLRDYTTGRLFVIFGAGGDRDKGKREEMGKVACSLADVRIITDDNPRSESPASIRQDIMKGCHDSIEIGDRYEAIGYGINNIEKGDTLLIAGKGHESGQIIGSTQIDFHDPSVVMEILDKKSF